MKYFIITLFVTFGLLFSGSSFAATTLSDTELAGVSGGGIDPQLQGQSLPQEQQQPEKNSGYTKLRQPQSIDGMELNPELFVILQSKIDVERKRKLLLYGTTQQNAIALNLENVLSSDIVSTNNIFNGDSITVDDVTSEIEINQINDLSQRHRTKGNLTTSIANHRYEKSELRSSGSNNYNYVAYSYVDQARINEYVSSNTRVNSVTVGKRYTSLEQLKEKPPEIITKNQLGWLNLLDFQVDELNYGAGVDIKGSGLIVANDARFRLDAEANVELCFFIWCWDVTIARFDVDKKLRVMDSTFIRPESSGDTQIEPVVQDDKLVEEYKAVDVAENSFIESYEHSIFTGGQMTGAEAELLALSDGSLSVNNSSTVLLSESAQKNMRVFNGVNAVASVAANAFNLSRLPVITGTSTVSRLSMQQHNRFIQQR